MGLILSRKVGQRIMIDGGRVEIIVLQIGGGEVKLMFEAPEDCTIIRAELEGRYDRKAALRGRTGAT